MPGWISAAISLIASLLGSLPKILEVITGWTRNRELLKEKAAKDARNKAAIRSAIQIGSHPGVQ